MRQRDRDYRWIYGGLAGGSIAANVGIAAFGWTDYWQYQALLAKVSTVRGLFSGSPNSKRAWGGGHVGGLTELGSNVVGSTGVNCK